MHWKYIGSIVDSYACKEKEEPEEEIKLGTYICT